MAMADSSTDLSGHLQEEIDFCSFLPPELVACVISHLSWKDYLSCMLVSKLWYSLLGEMECYWKTACREIGISISLLTRLRPLYLSSKAVFFQALQHRNSICTSFPTTRSLSPSYPYYMHYTCHSATTNYLIGTLYKFFLPNEILVQRLEGIMETVLTLRPMPPINMESRLVWAHLYKEKLLICVSGSGVWSVFELAASKLLLRWNTEEMYDRRIMFACCGKCSTVCVAKLIICSGNQPFWDIRIIEITDEAPSSKKRPRPPTVSRFHLKGKETNLSPRRFMYGKRKVKLLSNCDATDSFCNSHIILLQWASSISGHKMEHNKEGCLLLFQKPEYSFEVEYGNYEDTVMNNHELNTEFELTEDRSRIGFFFQSVLTSWELKPSQPQPNIAPVCLDGYRQEEIKLLALGHIYFIVGLERNSSFLILSTTTGQQILACRNFSSSLYSAGAVSPYVAFLSIVGKNWLSDISQPCRSSILFWNITNRSMEGVELGQELTECKKTDSGATGKTKKKFWWRQRKNQKYISS